MSRKGINRENLGSPAGWKVAAVAPNSEVLSPKTNEEFIPVSFYGANSWEDLSGLIKSQEERQGMLEGSGALLYSAEELEEIIGLVRQSRLPLSSVTRTDGLRAVVGELLAKERAARMAETIAETGEEGQPVEDKPAKPFAWVDEGVPWTAPGFVDGAEGVIDKLVGGRLANIEKELSTLKEQLDEKKKKLKVLEENLRSEGKKFHEDNRWLELTAQIAVIELQIETDERAKVFWEGERRVKNAEKTGVVAEGGAVNESAAKNHIDKLIEKATDIEKLQTQDLRALVHEVSWNIISLNSELQQSKIELARAREIGSEAVQVFEGHVQTLESIVDLANEYVVRIHQELAKRDGVFLGNIDEVLSGGPSKQEGAEGEPVSNPRRAKALVTKFRDLLLKQIRGESSDVSDASTRESDHPDAAARGGGSGTRETKGYSVNGELNEILKTVSPVKLENVLQDLDSKRPAFLQLLMAILKVKTEALPKSKEQKGG